MPDVNLIEVSGLEVRRDGFVLQVGSWHLQAGQVVGVVGPNGAGKTTLLEALAGLRPVTAGSVRVFGLDPWRDPVGVRTALGFASDDMAVFDMKVGALLGFLSGYYPTWDAALAEALVRRFALDPGQKAHRLSKGQATRLRLVTAMAFRPRVLVLDEPATGLDLAGRRSLLESVLEVVRDPERSVIVSSHQLLDVQRIADRLLVLNRGAVVHEGPTDALVGDERTLEEAMDAWGVAG